MGHLDLFVGTLESLYINTPDIGWLDDHSLFQSNIGQFSSCGGQTPIVDYTGYVHIEVGDRHRYTVYTHQNEGK